MRNNEFGSAFVGSGLTQEEAIRMCEGIEFQSEWRQNCWVEIIVQDLV